VEERRTNRSAGYRGRLAPSPTGHLHLGHARTFWTAFERARGGTLVLRNEDLDPGRSRAEFADAMLEDLRWLGIRWQEGPDVGGPVAPYSQSERRPLYLEAWSRLAAGGLIYPCACSRRDLARAPSAPHEGLHAFDDEPLYPGTCRLRAGARSSVADSPAGVVGSPAGTNWRFRVPDGEEVAFQDLRLGRQPAYQLAVVTDDALMKITEVVRGEDLLKSTARQILLQRALNLATPDYYHCPLVTDEAGARLAKRHESLSLRALRAAGVTPEQLRARFARESW
jgi:glutamyl-tRNA synthetase